MKYEEKLARLRMIRTKSIGSMTFSNLLRQYGSGLAALDALPDLMARSGMNKLISLIASKKSVENEMEKVENLGGKIVVRGEPDYPAPLMNFDDAPGCLTMLGHPHLGHQKSVAVVGSRNASLNSIAFAEKLAEDLSQQGYAVVSGLARGIDGAAHRGALKHGTIGVLAGGIDQIYPRENEKLYRFMSDQGLIVTEMPLGTPATARLFPIRNRIIASLSLGTVVVEASLNSGSLITARDAAERGREVMAIPGNPMDSRAVGCNSLIKDGAHLVRDAYDIINIVKETDLEMPSFKMRTPARQTEITFVDKSMAKEIKCAKTIMEDLLSFDATEVDELIRRCHLSASIVNIALLELELSGKVVRAFGNRVMKVYSSPED